NKGFDHVWCGSFMVSCPPIRIVARWRSEVQTACWIPFVLGPQSLKLAWAMVLHKDSIAARNVGMHVAGSKYLINPDSHIQDGYAVLSWSNPGVPGVVDMQSRVDRTQTVNQVVGRDIEDKSW